MIYLDTHAVLWTYFGEKELLSKAALAALDEQDLLVSPAVLLEIQFLQEVQKIAVGPLEVFDVMQHDFGVKVCPIPFYDVTRTAYKEAWTRDPFDRLIAAHAKAGRGKLLTKDRRIREYFEDAVW